MVAVDTLEMASSLHTCGAPVKRAATDASSLLDVGADPLYVLVEAMAQSGAGDDLSRLAATCSFFGGTSRGDSLVTVAAKATCQAAGVGRQRRGFCWPRMLSWVRDAVQVGPCHNHKTIESAVRTAMSHSRRDGALVIVSHGAYVENGIEVGSVLGLPPAKSLHIWARDEQQRATRFLQPVIWSHTGDHLLLINSGTVSVYGIDFRAYDAGREGGVDDEDEEAEEEEEDVTVDPLSIFVSGGAALRMSHCSVCCDGGSGVNVFGGGSSCVIDHCAIVGCTLHGVKVGRGSCANVSDSTIRHNRGDGIHAQDAGTVVAVHGCDVICGESSGVSVHAGARGFVTQCSIGSNEVSNVSVFGAETYVELCESSLCFSASTGVLVHDEACAYLQSNVIAGNGTDGVSVHFSQVILEGNLIRENKVHGVSVESGLLQMNHNSLSANKSTQCMVAGGCSKASLTGNEILPAQRYSRCVCVAAGAEATLNANQLMHGEGMVEVHGEGSRVTLWPDDAVSGNGGIQLTGTLVEGIEGQGSRSSSDPHCRTASCSRRLDLS